MTIALRLPTPCEQHWLDLGTRGNYGTYLTEIGFKYSGKRYSHPLIPPDICKTFVNGEAVLDYMVRHGIPNSKALGDDDWRKFSWWIRLCHVDMNLVKDAELSLKGLKPEMTTHIVTDESLKEILTAKKVVFRDDGRIYLAGASTLPGVHLVCGVHYASSLDQLRTMIRETGSWVAPDTKVVGSRSGRACAVADTLVIQLWAACGPEPLPTFGASRGERDDCERADSAEGVDQRPRRVQQQRVSTPIMEGGDDETVSGHDDVQARPQRHQYVLPPNESSRQEEQHDYYDSEGSLVDKPVQYHVLLKQQARGDKYKAIALRLQEENGMLMRKNNALKALIARLGQKRQREISEDEIE